MLQSAKAAAISSTTLIRNIFLVTICGFVLALSACSRESASGIYLAEFSNGIARLQIVETSDQRITGQLDFAFVEQSGELKTTSASVSGATDGQTLSLTFKQNEMLGRSGTGSGNLTSDGLVLTGDFNGSLSTKSFRKVSEAQYQEAFNAIKAQVAQGLSAREAAQNAAKLTEELGRFSSAAADTQVALMRIEEYARSQSLQVPAVIERTKKLTSQMESLLARRASMHGDGQIGVARSQLGIAINQGDLAAEAIARDISRVRDEITYKAVPVLSKAQSILLACAAKEKVTSPIPCEQLTKAYDRVQPIVVAFYGKLKTLETGFQSERQKQADILKRSEAIAN